MNVVNQVLCSHSVRLAWVLRFSGQALQCHLTQSGTPPCSSLLSLCQRMSCASQSMRKVTSNQMNFLAEQRSRFTRCMRRRATSPVLSLKSTNLPCKKQKRVRLF
ncbi:hypothetical protein E2C01_019811 [Portunus trituberculatus]|uniref:Uncharacterized protein n=1 Tax=Portunus trituberculatus TaxID=210409 RepID=A0A5B7E1G6_PORTR|nr:hypothetical protein [Portunus trituberculatus]